MAEKNRYPQIPSTVWWGVRAILQKTPNATVDERMLGVSLGVQETAARAYLAELKAVGILSDENKATPLAHKWRLDDTYAEAMQDLVAATYPEGLRHMAPPGEGDRQKITAWFQREGLGQGAAGNKAASYILLSSATPNEAPSRTTGRTTKSANGSRKVKVSDRPQEATAVKHLPKTNGCQDNAVTSREAFPLNVNVQIHISADAGTEQIESIFSAMRRYLYDVQSD
ncbi:DUF5343 domain-containing protein [Methylocystis rosea]|uniref:DUF5343 domain-containing protein n=1 Tax=Methylocystis rosea TaxID=173366 RepID=A0A3G8M3L2_9HYPH|nr:DUF5343 domain-containing protein [Methylocystis rosea]AZG75600.1 hypothetical protein EHO51_01950 [Methylocystis rosea]